MTHPERIIRQRPNTADVLRSDHLVGCYGLKPVPQTRPHACGAAAVATVLRYLGKEADEYHCTEALLPSPVVGVTWWPIVKYLRKRGVKALGWVHYSVDQIIENVKAGAPTLVEWLDWSGHWVVCCGYDKATDALVFADPARPGSQFTCCTTKEFKRHWMSGGTGSMEHNPALAVEVKISKIRDDASYEYVKHQKAKDVLYDWRTKKMFIRKQQHALA